MNKKNERIAAVLAAAVILVGVLFSAHLLSIAGNCPTFPSSIISSFVSGSQNPYTGTYTSGFVQVGCQNNFGAGTSLTSVLYNIYYQDWLGAPVGLETRNQVNITIATQPNATIINQANVNMSAQLPGINATIAYDQQQAAQNECSGCNSYSAEAWNAKAQANTQGQQLLLKSIAYNNALLKNSTSTATTTMPVTTIQTPPPQPPSPGILGTLTIILSNFIASIQQFFAQYFSTSFFSVFSIGVTNVSSSNITTLGSQLTGTVSLTIPQADVSNVWTPSITTLTRTYCQAAVKYNDSSTFLENTSIVNMSTTSFTGTLPVKATQPGILIFGGACVTTNNTYNFTKGGWNGWTAYKNVTIQHFAIYVAAPATLTTSASPSGAGNIVPPTGQHAYGSQVILGEQANSGYQFISWKGTGRGNYTGTNPSPTITMNNNITETAIFQVSTNTPPPPPPPSILQQIQQAITSILTAITSFFSGLGI